MRIEEEDSIESALEIVRSVASLPSEDQRIIVKRRVLRKIFRTYWRKFHGGWLVQEWGPDEGKKALLELAGYSEARSMRPAFRLFLRRTDQNSKNAISPSDARNLLLLFQLAEKEVEPIHASSPRSPSRFSRQDAEEVLKSTIEELRRYEQGTLDLLSKTLPPDARLRAKAHAYSHAADLLEDAILRIPLMGKEEVLKGTIEELKRYEQGALNLLSKILPPDARLRAKSHAYSDSADLLEDAILRISLIDEDQEVEEEGKPL